MSPSYNESQDLLDKNTTTVESTSQRQQPGISLDTLLSLALAGLFCWFIASSFVIAWQKAPQHDDAMFATIPKNFLAGYGWATSYGEKIPFNPDISTGPTLLLPAAAMIALFGNKPWVPAMTGLATNVFLLLLVSWQLWQFATNRRAALLALLLSVSLFAVNDLKTFTGYYSAALLFLFSLLLVSNRRYSLLWRVALYGGFAAIGYYAKPLILLSFLVAFPVLLLFECRTSVQKWLRYIVVAASTFALVVIPWQLFKQHTLAQYDDGWRASYKAYSDAFFANHGTGISQLQQASEPLKYLHWNMQKNAHTLARFLDNENSFPVLVFVATLFVALLLPVLFLKDSLRLRAAHNMITLDVRGNHFMLMLAVTVLANIAWYVVLSFAMTPGHAFFLVFDTIFLLFFLASQLRAERIGVFACCALVLMFGARHQSLVEAYQFRERDPYIKDSILENTINHLQQHPARYPLASCGYNAAPWRIEYLLPSSGNFVDCYNVLEDALASHDNGATYYWKSAPDFTFVFESLAVINAIQSQAYVLKPIADACLAHAAFRDGTYVVCDVAFNDIRDKLEPTETARQLASYRHWYQTRIRP